MSFQTLRSVKFQDCDPAGIVFYPRYFEMLDEAVEDWLLQAGTWHYPSDGNAFEAGPQIARIEVEFHRPSRLGDQLVFELRLQGFDERRMKISASVFSGNEQRLRAFLDLGWTGNERSEGGARLPSLLQHKLARTIDA
ncbi:acyl-CoA thioesterase [Marinobacter orientalis]|uniref:Acyl-CoA thioesterase n=1 Tax=Marinobacter orientalis TaxID=1928859 RepID=A0A7Y0NJU0_9GAMM|nr:acyl-CoA thioesterase [Marinobacter orientalis]NMT62725.1 acyl-CoA thioesterase [Marinobacter orientalis]TGX51408.1 acyl-CoA thioesterase [Marinobacter orientalis]